MVEKKKIYLSLPISGYDIEERRSTARSIADALSDEWEVVNPLENGLPADAGTHAHMRRDFELLIGCDAIFMMERSVLWYRIPVLWYRNFADLVSTVS